MKHLRRRRHSSYENLWLTSKPLKQEVITKTDEDIQIEQLMLEADLCENLESYVRTLGIGMQSILKSKALTAAALKNKVFETKMKRIGVDIIEKCREESDLYYVGVFAGLKLCENWLDSKLYALLANLIDHVVKKGLKISELLKEKIKAKLLKFMQTYEHRDQMAFITPSLNHT